MLDTVITIPSRRPAPVLTFGSYETSPYTCFIVSDPDRYDEHYSYYRGIPGIYVMKGEKGNGAQCAACCEIAAREGFQYFFKLDDDIMPRTFVGLEPGNEWPTLVEAVQLARKCLDSTNTTLAGFANTSRKDWLSEGFNRTYGLIHGAGCIGVADKDSSKFVDRRLMCAEDVYRTCAHREMNGAVGRISFVGFNKRQSNNYGDQPQGITSQQFLDTRDIILHRFPGMVTCDGVRYINNGTTPIANWRMRKKRGVDR